MKKPNESKGQEAHGGEWKKHHRQVREKFSLQDKQSSRWMEKRGSGYNFRASQRVLDMINLAWDVEYSRNRTMSMEELEQRLMIDISQSAHRIPWSTKLRSITTSTALYSYRLKRVLHPLELLSLLGFPLQKISLKAEREISPKQIQDLAGEAMALPCAGLIAQALALSLPLWQNSS